MRRVQYLIVLALGAVLAGAAPPAGPPSVNKCLGLFMSLHNGTLPAGTIICPDDAAVDKWLAAGKYPITITSVFDLGLVPSSLEVLFKRIAGLYTIPGLPLAGAAIRKGSNEYETACSNSFRGVATKQKVAIKKSGASSFKFQPKFKKSKAATMTPDLAVPGVDPASTAVHAVNVMQLPENTFITIAEALKASTGLSITTKHSKSIPLIKERIVEPTTRDTFFAATNEAWLKIIQPWTGKIGKGVRHDLMLQQKLALYCTLKYYADQPWPLNATHTWDDLFAAAAKVAPAQIPLPSLVLTANSSRVPLYMYATGSNPASDDVKLLGGRNTVDGELKESILDGRTIFAGASVVLPFKGYIPIPATTSLPEYD